MREFPRSLLFRLVHSDRNLELIRELLALGEDPNRPGYGGRTPFHAAIDNSNNNDGVIQELIAAGADVNLADHLDTTPLHFAVVRGKRNAVAALLDAGAFVQSRNFLGEAALHHAVTGWEFFTSDSKIGVAPDSSIIKMLLNHEYIDYNAVDSNGNTPLMIATKYKQEMASFDCCYTTVQFLNNGASIYAVNAKGQTPMDILIQRCIEGKEEYWIVALIKMVAVKYHINKDLKQKFKCLPFSSQFFENCCDEVDRMRHDALIGNVTVHDFFWNCIHEPHFSDPVLQIYKPVVERLVDDSYPNYIFELLDRVSLPDLGMVLQLTIASRKNLKCWRGEDGSSLFAKLDIIYMLIRYLKHVDIFCLILAYSNVKILKSMQNLRKRRLDIIFEAKNAILKAFS